MIRRMLSTILAITVLSLVTVHPVAARSKEERQAAKRLELTQKIHDGIVGLGTGPDAKIEVTLRDKTKLVGYVASAELDTFVVHNVKTGVATQVAYGDVTKVKGNNLATGWKIAIGAGVLFAVLLILVWTGAIGDAER